MIDAQITTLALVFIAALGAILYNNSRITDLRTDNNARISELRGDVNRRFDDVNRHIDDKFALVMQRLERMEDNLTRLLGDHEIRIHKLEHPDG